MKELEKDIFSVLLDLKEENENLKDKVMKLSDELKYSKHIELLEFVRDLYSSLNAENDKLTKEEIMFNLKTYMENFAKDNNIEL